MQKKVDLNVRIGFIDLWAGIASTYTIRLASSFSSHCSCMKQCDSIFRERQSGREKVIDASFPLVNLKIITHTFRNDVKPNKKNYIETQMRTVHVISIINSILDLRASMLYQCKLKATDRNKGTNKKYILIAFQSIPVYSIPSWPSARERAREWEKMNFNVYVFFFHSLFASCASWFQFQSETNWGIGNFIFYLNFSICKSEIEKRMEKSEKNNNAVNANASLVIYSLRKNGYFFLFKSSIAP